MPKPLFTTKPEPITQEVFVALNGTLCPACGDGDGVYPLEGHANYDKCKACGAVWRLLYGLPPLTGYRIIKT